MNIRPLQRDEVSGAAEVLAQAFLQDPVYRHMIYCNRRRRNFLKEMMEVRLRFALEHGKAFITEDGLGVVACLPAGTHMPLREMIALGGLKVVLFCAPWNVVRMLRFMRFMGQCEEGAIPPLKVYRTLGPMGVAPEARGRGYGTALLRHVMEYGGSDRDDMLIVTQSERNRDMYRKFGFSVLQEKIFAGTEIPCIVMYRGYA